MKVFSSDDKVTVFAYNMEDIEINDYIKGLILRLKRKYNINLFGFYQVNVYKNPKVGMIIDMIKEDGMDYFNDLVDLKIKIYDNSDVYYTFNDYFFNAKKDFKLFNNKYYINIDDLSEKEFLLMTEFCSCVYGDELEKIQDKLLA